jgi:hypothetical protein
LTVEKWSVREEEKSKRNKWQKKRMKRRVGLRQSAGKTIIIGQSDSWGRNMCKRVAYKNLNSLKTLPKYVVLFQPYFGI